MFVSDMSAPHIAALVAQVSSRSSMAAIITGPWPQLYRDELKQRSLDDVAESMRHDVAITTRSIEANGSLIDISFTYPDPAQAQRAVQRIMTRLDEANTSALTKNDPLLLG
jgi:hypothetical protein